MLYTEVKMTYIIIILLPYFKYILLVFTKLGFVQKWAIKRNTDKSQIKIKKKASKVYVLKIPRVTLFNSKHFLQKSSK